jgi:hypothetical protein
MAVTELGDEAAQYESVLQDLEKRTEVEYNKQVYDCHLPFDRIVLYPRYCSMSCLCVRCRATDQLHVSVGYYGSTSQVQVFDR